MEKIRVTKIEAAQRQTDAAIRMLFNGEDPVAVHTVAAAAGRILKDIAEQRGSAALDLFNARIREDKRKEFWGLTNRAANFFKHADKDPEEILEDVPEEANDVFLFINCLLYQDLGHQLTSEMFAFVSWHMGMYPNLLKDDSSLKSVVIERFGWLSDLPRDNQLQSGKLVLQEVERMNRQGEP